MKKRLFIYITAFFIGSFMSTAQKKGGPNFEKIKTLKINFISSELNLTPEVAEKFWPIYNKYEKLNHELRSSKIKNIKDEIDTNGSVENLTDKKAIELSEKFIGIADKYAENKRKCFEELGVILTPQQLLKLHFSEMDFNYKVLRKLRKEKKATN